MNRFAKIISGFIENDSKPVVIYASLWPFIKALNLKKPEDMLNVLLEIISGGRDFLMPTFASGYVNGKCNLDLELSTTGILSEAFRNLPQSKRTLSAFFSFNIIGASSDIVLNLMPEHAWGEGSVYEWMEKSDVHFIMLGIHPTHCSFLHRLEWLVRDKINYRYSKEFKGTLIRENLEHVVTETLYVRSYNPPVVNDFTNLTNFLLKSGMVCADIEGINISHYNAKSVINTCLPAMQEDPFLVLKNRLDYQTL